MKKKKNFQAYRLLSVYVGIFLGVFQCENVGFKHFVAMLFRFKMSGVGNTSIFCL